MPTPHDVAVLLQSLYEGTRAHRLAWTKQDDQNLVLELSDEYSVTMKLIGAIDRDQQHDHVVTLLHRHRQVWSVDRLARGDLGALIAWAQPLQQFQGGRLWPHSFFNDLWDLALQDATEGTGHVLAAAALGRRLAVS